MQLAYFDPGPSVFFDDKHEFRIKLIDLKWRKTRKFCQIEADPMEFSFNINNLFASGISVVDRYLTPYCSTLETSRLVFLLSLSIHI